MPAIDYSKILPVEAIALQKSMREQVVLQPLKQPVYTIGGADISFNKYSTTVYAGIVTLSFPGMQVIDEATAVTEVKFPYVPGLLAFREIPAILNVWNLMEHKPDILVFDGHGIAHPRRMGIATHFGLVTNSITIGCAKSLLCGEYEVPANEPFSTSDIIHKGEIIGQALRTKKNCKPIHVSPGHFISLQESVEIMKQCTGKYRIPEPTRLAHILVNRVRKNAQN